MSDHDDARPEDGATPTAGNARTRFGQIAAGLNRVTRQIQSTVSLQRRTPASPRLESRLTILIGALGDPHHPLHQRASADLLALGEAAVAPLCTVLRAESDWLRVFRAAEILGQLGDARAVDALLGTLNHPNSNARWSAVRALAAIGDARALLALRRLARDDRGKTSWGESVAGAAQSAIDQLQSRDVLALGLDLLQTAIACVVMIIAVNFSAGIVANVQAELDAIGRVDPAALAPAAPLVRTVEPVSAPPAGERPTVAAPVTTGTIIADGPVRAAAAIEAQPVGALFAGDTIRFEATSPDGLWFRVRLIDRVTADSRIESADGSAWIEQALVEAPTAALPVEPGGP